MEKHTYTKALYRHREDVTITKEGKEVECVQFDAVLRAKVANPDYVEKPKGEKDERTPIQKSKTSWFEATKPMEVEKAKDEAETEARIMEAVIAWRDKLEDLERLVFSVIAHPDPLPFDLKHTDHAKPGRKQQKLIDYLRSYVADREAKGAIERSTASEYRKTVRRLGNYFKDKRLADLTETDVTHFFSAELKRGVSEAT